MTLIGTQLGRAASARRTDGPMGRCPQAGAEGRRVAINSACMRMLAGTSGWSYPAWKGSFYPPELRERDMLAAYAARLPVVEVNNTFYRMPSPSTLQGWRSGAPPGFVFALKAPQRITHKLRLADAGVPLAHFLRNATLLGEALGPILFQLPPWLRKDLPRLRDFLAIMPRSFRVAFEFRHASWFDDEVLGALADAGAALCVAEDDEASTPLRATAGFGYLRLRRRDYDAAAIAAWAERIAAMPWSESFVFFKHEDGARGPAYAELLTRRAGAEGAAASAR